VRKNKNIGVIALSLKQHYASLLVVSIVILTLALLNLPVINSVWQYSFDDGTYSHAYIIPLIMAYLFRELVITNRLAFRQAFSPLFFIALLLCHYVFFVSVSAQISAGYWLMLPVVVLSSLLLIFKFSFGLAFAVFYVIFLLPIWGFLVVPLQNLSVSAVTIIMNFTHIPVFVQNEFIEIPSGTFEIAGGCSGLRYLITALAIGSLYAFLYIKSYRNVIFFMGIAILGALITNWIRITLLIVIGHETEMTSSLMEDHNTFGWYVFIPFMFLLFYIGNKLSSQPMAPTEVLAKPINLKTTALPLAGVILISALFSSNIHIDMEATIDPKSDSLASDMQPSIAYYSNKEVLVSSGRESKLRYTFTSGLPDEKPTFYLNNMLPKGWQEKSSTIENGWLVKTLIKGQQKATLKVQYQIDGSTAATAKQFKLLRIKKALLGNRETGLHWHLTVNG